MDIELITIINSFRKTIALNNLLIKEKILRKLEIIHTLYWYGFPLMNYSRSTNNKIMQELQNIDKEGDIVKYSGANTKSDTNKLLGNILHNAYQASGFNMILYNAPTCGTNIAGDFIQLDSEAIYDTLVQYTPIDTVISVCQISADTYLVKMASKENAVALCNLLNEKLLEGRIIKVEYIDSLIDEIKLVRNKSQFTNGYDINDIDLGESYEPSNLDDIIFDNKDIKDINKQSYFTCFLDIIHKFLQIISFTRQRFL
jgi:hypothetical protein